MLLFEAENVDKLFAKIRD